MSVEELSQRLQSRYLGMPCLTGVAASARVTRIDHVDCPASADVDRARPPKEQKSESFSLISLREPSRHEAFLVSVVKYCAPPG